MGTSDNDKILEDERWTVAWMIRYTIMMLITVGSSALSGLLGMGMLLHHAVSNCCIGSGTNFVLAFLYLMKFDLIEATGTGVFIMTGLMCSMSICYLLGTIDRSSEANCL